MRTSPPVTGPDPGAGERSLVDTSVTETVAELNPGLSASDVAVQVGIDPRAIGRFQVLRRLGRGGMGVVFSAYDEELDRRVAIKLLRGDRLRDPASMQRFRSEAQAMARLSHTNVVHIYEVGEHEGQLYIAMEYVQGRDLREWLHEPHSWRERLAVLCQAGRGLEAAHAAGIVHHDFKPDNVMVDHVGRVRVLDFGLAQTYARVPGEAASAASIRGFAGTPAYMSPEQHAGGVVDPRSDQFSFCVVLYEAVYGERPFQASSAAALAEAIALGQVKPPRHGSGAPRWLERAMLRGLCVDPAQRWPSMGALLAAAERDPARRRWQWFLVMFVIVALAVAAAILLGGRDGAAARCAAGAAQLDGVWGEQRRDAVHQAMVTTGLPYAEQVWQTTRDTLDAYAREWSAMHGEVCSATHVRGEQSAELFHLRMSCLGRARAELDALVVVLAATDRGAMENVARAPWLLPRLELCADEKALRSTRRRGAQELAAAEGLRVELATVKALLRVGRFVAARDALRPVLARGQALGEPTLLSELWFYDGDLAGKLGDYASAERGFLRAFTSAVAGEDDLGAARAALESIFVTGYFQAQIDDGERWAEIAAALLDRLGDEGLLRARLMTYRAVLRDERGDELGAAKLHQESVALNRKMGATPFTIAAGLNNMAVALGNSGDLDAAVTAYEEALAIYRMHVGDAHPNVATTLDNLATALSARGDLDAALPMHLDALQRHEAALGAGHPNLAVTLINIAGVYLDRGEPERALHHSERALALTRAALGEQHPLVRQCEAVLAHVWVRRGELAQARPVIERVVAGMQSGMPERRVELAYPLFVRAELDLAGGDAAAAARGFAEVLTLRDIRSGATHRERGLTLFGLARARWASGERLGLATLLAEADTHFATIHDEPQRRSLAAWAREHPGL